MGYYTYYDLDLSGSGINKQIACPKCGTSVTGKGELGIIEELRNRCEDAKDAFNEKGEAGDETKWYEHEEDMVKFSRNYPDVVFTLYGQGDGEERWYKYFKNGKMQFAPANISYDDYDEAKLVEPEKEEQDNAAIQSET